MPHKDDKKAIKGLQFKMLRVQQGVWHNKERVIIVFEGFDAAGKGGAIRKITEALDPRGFRVHPIGPPSEEEQGKHWLYRFWVNLPAPGTIAIFDRSWYGRVLVERVDGLTSKSNWKRAYSEINQFESMLKNDGIRVIKIFLSISKEEQLKRFQDRLNDPHKQWKIGKDDLRAREKWDDYVLAVDEIFKRTSDWKIIKGDDKTKARKEVLQVLTTKLRPCEEWINSRAMALGKRSLAKALKELT